MSTAKTYPKFGTGSGAAGQSEYWTYNPLCSHRPKSQSYLWVSSIAVGQVQSSSPFKPPNSSTLFKFHFTKEKETMLMTLSDRAIQSGWEHPILRDPWAEQAMRHIDYDMSKTLKGVSSWGIWKDIGCTIVATCAPTFDQLTTRYLADHPDATVIHVGCGMDSHVFRVEPNRPEREAER